MNILLILLLSLFSFQAFALDTITNDTVQNTIANVGIVAGLSFLAIIGAAAFKYMRLSLGSEAEEPIDDYGNINQDKWDKADDIPDLIYSPLDMDQDEINDHIYGSPL